LLASPALGQAAEFSAKVDRHSLALGEHATLTLTLHNSDTRLRAQGIDPNVDLSVLTRDFDVGVPKAQHRFNIYRGRGRSSSEIIVDLFPRRSGILTIPPFTVDGLSTAPITIRTVDASPEKLPELFNRSGVSQRQPYQRQQIVVWLDVYRRIELKSASLGEYLDAEPVQVELQEHRELPQSVRSETYRGAEYQVTRKAWAVYPRDAGELTFHLPDVWAETLDGRRLRLPHLSETVTVRPLPAAVTADIVVGKPEIEIIAPRTRGGAGESYSWTVTVRGPIERYALPDTLPLPPVPAGLKLYADRGRRQVEVSADGVTTSMTYTFSALPQHGGEFRLPAVRIPYFDTARGRVDVATALTPVLTVSGEIPAVAAPPADSGNGPRPATQRNSGWWPYTTALFAALWLGTLLLLLRWGLGRPPQTPRRTGCARRGTRTTTAGPMAVDPLQQMLLDAFGSRTLEQGLSAWERRHGRDSSVHATVTAVQRLRYGGISKTEDGTLTQAVARAAETIRRQDRGATGRPDPWRPESFTAQLAGRGQEE
ncbi:MAG TPA: hypothetical protein ENJ19_02590, partial [Gammaproteobacteria bacterium]|nr:hypothetical protein [Gammaproteobacteria bacterium]